MKLFKKVMAVVLVGAMAVSMLTACGSSSSNKAKDVKKALKKVGVTTTTAMDNETETAMTGLQDATKALAAASGDSEKNQVVATTKTKMEGMTDYTFHNNAGEGGYDLYIWTNSVGGRPTDPVSKYPYLMKVTNTHVENRLAVILSEQFVKQGQFKGSDADMEVLKKVLKDAGQVGISCQKVYGYDVLLVTVKKGATVGQQTADNIND